jgi:hypothetical protein
MELTNSLPKGPNTPRSLRLMKFIFQPIKYLDDYAKAYGDTFTIREARVLRLCTSANHKHCKQFLLLMTAS